MKFRIWLESEDVEIGKVISIPAQKDGRNPYVVQIIAVRGDTVWLRQIDSTKPPPDPKDNSVSAGGIHFKMTRAAVRHWQNDLMGKVKLNAHAKTDDPYIQKVLNGEGQYLGKGDDGVAFSVDNMVVKASTTVPFQPDSQWQRNPSGAAKMIVMNVRLTEQLRKQGVPGILPTYFKIVGDKAFMVRPMVDIKGSYSREQMKEIRVSIEAIHKAGYSINDEIQVGELDGRMYHFDLGKMAKISHKDDPKDDMRRYEDWAEKSGWRDPMKNWEYYLSMLTNFYTDDDEWRRKYLRKLISQKVLMDKEYPERKEETEKEMRQVVDA